MTLGSGIGSVARTVIEPSTTNTRANDEVAQKSNGINFPSCEYQSIQDYKYFYNFISKRRKLRELRVRNQKFEVAQKSNAINFPSCEYQSIQDYKYFYNSISKRRKPAPLRELTRNNLPPGTIKLGVGYPNVKSFPFQELKVVLKDSTEIELNGKQLEDALQYLPSVGYAPLIESLKDLQDKAHGQQCWNQKSLMVCTGSQEGLSKAVEMCIEVGDPVIVQSPTYSGILDILRPYNVEVIEIEQDKYGIQPAVLEKILRNRFLEGRRMPKLMYVNPTAANPTGATLTLERKLHVYELACKYNFLILEDDAYYFLHFLKENPVSFLSLDVAGRVIRFDSFSKILSSGIRTGYVTAPAPLIRQMELHMQVSTMHSSAMSQVILYQLLRKWGDAGLENHFENIRLFYNSRKDFMVSCAHKYLSDLAEWNEPSGGMFLWIKIVGLRDVKKLVLDSCLNNCIVLAPGHVFRANPDSKQNFVRVSYSCATESEIELAFSKLAHLIRAEISNS